MYFVYKTEGGENAVIEIFKEDLESEVLKYEGSREESFTNAWDVFSKSETENLNRKSANLVETINELII